MESIHSPKKSGVARAGVWATSLLLALLLLLPAAWYARYRDQLAAPAARSVPFLMAPPSRPSGIIPLPPPAPGKARTVQIQHVGGRVITTVNDGDMRITTHEADPHPPSNPVDALGQSLCDRYNAWRCARGDPQQSANTVGPTTIGPSTDYVTYEMVLQPAHAPGIPAPAPSLHSAARMPARL